MKAVVFHGVGRISVDEVEKPTIEAPTDAVVRLTASAICGTDLHFIRGTMAGTREGRILGHEGVGVVEQVGDYVRNLVPGDRVVIPSTVACGTCSYCRAGYYAQCDNANPNGPGTAFFGGPEDAGGLDGLQAQYARIPYANVGLVKLPDQVSDEQAILISDIFPTGYQAAEQAEIETGDVVCVFGCGPVGQFAIWSARYLGAGRVIAVDSVADRLEAAREQGCEVVNFMDEDPVEMIHEMTRGVGPDRVIDCVGIDANRRPGEDDERFEEAIAQLVPERAENGWQPGSGPTQALEWAVEVIAKAGTLSIIGVYPPTCTTFPIGAAFMKNLTVKLGNCNHRAYIPKLVELVRTGVIDPTVLVTKHEPMSSAVEAYEAFDKRTAGWLKIELEPQAAAAETR
ncbi:MAG TPA: zinc-dependent alcohol dehydrogenase [Gaiellaceae bacterium]|jgi:threonine dehydrogenase-like Zn-dependent dehydrogenase|nr:zinc-dependent alcohol dehydrogenase [Gaiellaceae bacterium]